MILDTDVLIDLMERQPSAVEKLSALIHKNTPLTITTPSIFELFTGLAQSTKPVAELEKIHRVIHQQPRWALDDSSAERAGRIHGELARRGESIGSVDAMIAGIALQHQEPVLTRNVKHFSRVSGLKVETY
ncbi:tRNA(fMet)-specific endonuclease VapC [uncultured archaeon]|nr:tRNA(fMet)-specific endonuclease VapC [uncultured archaeon]